MNVTSQKKRETYLGSPVAMQKRSIISLELQYLLKSTFQTEQQQEGRKNEDKEEKGQLVPSEI